MSINPEEPLNCPARVTLDATQSAYLDELCPTAPSLQAELGCELEGGHAGSHAALGQQVEDVMWWVHWTLTASEINKYTWCTAKRASDGENRDDDGCVLFHGHSGRHSSAKTYWEQSEKAA
jgi:hypothetical protein